MQFCLVWLCAAMVLCNNANGSKWVMCTIVQPWLWVKILAFLWVYVHICAAAMQNANITLISDVQIKWVKIQTKPNNDLMGQTKSAHQMGQTKSAQICSNANGSKFKPNQTMLIAKLQ